MLDGTLAQLVEHRAFNPLVEGSSPSRPTGGMREKRETVRKLQCPKCESTEILYCPIVEEWWTIETIHESGGLDLKDVEDSVTTGEHS